MEQLTPADAQPLWDKGGPPLGQDPISKPVSSSTTWAARHSQPFFPELSDTEGGAPGRHWAKCRCRTAEKCLTTHLEFKTARKLPRVVLIVPRYL